MENEDISLMSVGSINYIKMTDAPAEPLVSKSDSLEQIGKKQSGETKAVPGSIITNQMQAAQNVLSSRPSTVDKKQSNEGIASHEKSSRLGDVRHEKQGKHYIDGHAHVGMVSPSNVSLQSTTSTGRFDTEEWKTKFGKPKEIVLTNYKVHKALDKQTAEHHTRSHLEASRASKARKIYKSDSIYRDKKFLIPAVVTGGLILILAVYSIRNFSRIRGYISFALTRRLTASQAELENYAESMVLNLES